jgi:hypothetical protein
MARRSLLQYDCALLRLAACPPQGGRTDVAASLAGYCCLEHAKATPRPTLAAAQQLYEEIVEGAGCICGHCTADSFGAKAINKLIDAFPDPIAVTDVEDYEEKDRRHVLMNRSAGPTMNQDPVRDADTNPDTWLHAPDLFAPRAAAQCYPHMFMILLEVLKVLDPSANVGDLIRTPSDDDLLDLLTTQLGIFTCPPEDVLMFLAKEVIVPMVLRINERYPVTKGCSPVAHRPGGGVSRDAGCPRPGVHGGPTS